MSNFEIIPVSSADILDISTAASDELSILGSFELWNSNSTKR